MHGILGILASNKALITSFVLMLLCGAGFGLYTDDVGGRLLDETLNQTDALATLASMTTDQKDSHFWVTVLLDTAYPVLYGAFFVGAIARLAGKHRTWAIWPSMIGVDSDFAENIVQAIALNGNTDWLFLKDILTPLKFGGLAVGLLLILFFGIMTLAKRFNKTATKD